LGYVEGNNYILEVRGGGAKADRLFDLAAELVRLEVEVFVAVGSPALPCRDESNQYDSYCYEDRGAIR
jgi:hypothetical protein